MKKLFAAVAAVGALSMGAAKADTVYNYTMVAGTPTGANAGQISALSASYSNAGELGFSATIDLRDDRPAVNGGWFVFSPGGMPMNNDEVAIFYMDFDGGDLFAYKYDTHLAETSWTDTSNYITTYDDVLSVENDGTAVSFSFADLFVGAVQTATFAATWTGAAFGETFGGWIHFSALDEFATDNGVITAFDTGWQSYLDVENRPTDVPEPAGLALLGLAGVFGARALKARRA